MFTSRATKTIEIPGEPGVTVTIRKLSHHQLMMATDDNVDRVIDKFKKMGESVAHLPDRGDDSEAQLPTNKYNHATVLRCGVTGWSYPDECNEANILDQDEAWADFVFDEILALSLRSKDEGEASGSDSPPTSA